MIISCWSTCHYNQVVSHLGPTFHLRLFLKFISVSFWFPESVYLFSFTYSFIYVYLWCFMKDSVDLFFSPSSFPCVANRISSYFLFHLNTNCFYRGAERLIRAWSEHHSHLLVSIFCGVRYTDRYSVHVDWLFGISLSCSNLC